MISSLCWIPIESVAAKPRQYSLTEEEYERVMRLTETKVRETKEQIQHEMQKMKLDHGTEDKEINEKYQMDDYDSGKGESDADDGGGSEDDEEYKEALLSRIEDLIVEDGGDGDANDGSKDAEEEESDADDLACRRNDRVIVCGRTEDEVSYLDMYVYEESDDNNLYVHHDIMLPSMPLCVQNINYNLLSATPADNNFVAVGSFEPDIEIWNMDVLDVACPAAILKGHSGAVMSLAWNSKASNVMASGSADKSIILWDLGHVDDPQKCKVKKLKKHSDKVQSVAWSTQDPHYLASGSYDRSVRLTDVRSFTTVSIADGLGHDPEVLRWNPFIQSQLFCSDESGTVKVFDIRSPASCLRNIDAHHKACTVIDFHPIVPGLLLTASIDRTFKLWDVSSDSNVRCLLGRESEGGKIFTAGFASDSPFIVAYAGSRGKLHVQNLDDCEPYRNYVHSKLSS